MNNQTAIIFIQNFIDNHNIKLIGNNSKEVFQRVYDEAVKYDNDLVISCLNRISFYKQIDEYFKPIKNYDL